MCVLGKAEQSTSLDYRVDSVNANVGEHLHVHTAQLPGPTLQAKLVRRRQRLGHKRRLAVQLFTTRQSNELVQDANTLFGTLAQQMKRQRTFQPEK